MELVSIMASTNGMMALIEPDASTAPAPPDAFLSAAVTGVAVSRQSDTRKANPQIKAFCWQTMATPLRMALSVVRSALTE
jgi:hypothetical protein